MKNSDRIAWLETVTNQNVEQVGGKNASLGELISALKPAGIRVPGGFAITASAYRAFVDFNQLTPQIESILSAWEGASSRLRQRVRRFDGCSEERHFQMSWRMACGGPIRN